MVKEVILLCIVDRVLVESKGKASRVIPAFCLAVETSLSYDITSLTYENKSYFHVILHTHGPLAI